MATTRAKWFWAAAGVAAAAGVVLLVALAGRPGGAKGGPILWEARGAGGVFAAGRTVAFGVRSSFALFGHTIGGVESSVLALDAKTGAERWRFDKGVGVIACGENVVCVISADAFLYNVDTDTGEELSRYSFYDYLGFPVIVDGRTVYIVSSSGLTAVDADTGAAKWTLDVPAAPQHNVVFENTTVFFASLDQNLYALDAETGNEKWRFAMGNAAAPQLASAGGMIIFQDHRDGLKGIDAETGVERWRMPGRAAPRSGFASDGNAVYYVGTDNALSAIDAGSGREKWRLDLPEDVGGGPLLKDGMLYLESPTKGLFGVSARTGQETWGVALSDTIVSDFAAADGVVVFSDRDGYVYAVDAQGSKEE